MSDPAAAVKRIETVAAPAAAGERADRFLAEASAGAGTPLSRARVKGLIEAGCATRDGAVLRSPAEAVRAGARYRLDLPPAAPASPPPQAIPLAILFEDADLIVIDKPAGLVVHPAPGNLDGTLVNALLAHCGTKGLPGIGGVQRPGIVHRLDRDTSGVMVVAKTDVAMAGLSAAFGTRNLDRAYLALCWGLPAPPSGRIEGAIGRDPRDRKRMAVVPRGGRDAATQYRLLRAWAASVALLECRLETGRTHQIRVHLASAGHPLLGDPVYLRRTPAAARALPAPARQAALAFPRQALHAASLGFRHPITGATLRFETAPPPDMARLIASLDAESGQG
jgi:23S rRNA pseudouridine1911/1915/1917 synthase